MRKFLLIVAVSFAISGCGILYKQPIYQGNLIEKSNAEQLAVGQSRQQVIALLGTPSIADPFHAQRWDYTAAEHTNRRGTTVAEFQRFGFDARLRRASFGSICSARNSSTLSPSRSGVVASALTPKIA